MLPKTLRPHPIIRGTPSRERGSADGGGDFILVRVRGSKARRAPVRSRGEVGRSSIGGIDGAAFLSQDLMKQLGNMSPGFFSQIVPETHILCTLDQILHDPFPEVIRQCHPINLCLSVPFPKRRCLWFPDKDEIALFGCQHHFIPIDHKHVTSRITEQIGCMQVRVTDDVWTCSSLKHTCQLFQRGHSHVNRGLMRHPVGAKSTRRFTSTMSRMEVLGLKGPYPPSILRR